MNIKKIVRPAIVFCTIAAWITACTPSAQTPSAGEVQTVVAVTFAAMTVQSASTTAIETPSAATEAPTTEVTAAAFTPYVVRTSAQNVNLRLGPGTLFKVSRVMAQGTSLEIHGISNGGEWLYVKNDEGIFGWVGVNVVEGVNRDTFTPTVEPGDIFLVTGTVKTEPGVPVNGIGFALTQVGFSSRRTDAVTDSTGRFYAYIPSTLSGSWTVEYVSVACTSNTMDSNCNCKGGRCGAPDPRFAEISLPFSGELIFVWK
jgi:uncharacterized protein YraI